MTQATTTIIGTVVEHAGQAAELAGGSDAKAAQTTR